MIRQRTLKSTVRATGVGMHTGRKVYLTLRPAAPDTGIVFRRIDLPQPVELKAHATLVGDTRLSSCLEVGAVRVIHPHHDDHRPLQAFGTVARRHLDGPVRGGRSAVQAAVSEFGQVEKQSVDGGRLARAEAQLLVLPPECQQSFYIGNSHLCRAVSPGPLVGQTRNARARLSKPQRFMGRHGKQPAALAMEAR